MYLGGGEWGVWIAGHLLKEGRQPAVEALLDQVSAKVEVDLAQIAVGLDDARNREAP